MTRHSRSNFTIDDEEQSEQLKGNQKRREKAKQAKNTANEKKDF